MMEDHFTETPEATPVAEDKVFLEELIRAVDIFAAIFVLPALVFYMVMTGPLSAPGLHLLATVVLVLTLATTCYVAEDGSSIPRSSTVPVWPGTIAFLAVFAGQMFYPEFSATELFSISEDAAFDAWALGMSFYVAGVFFFAVKDARVKLGGVNYRPACTEKDAD